MQVILEVKENCSIIQDPPFAFQRLQATLVALLRSKIVLPQGGELKEVHSQVGSIRCDLIIPKHLHNLTEV